MTTIIINGVEMEGKVGERVLNVARRNAAHIGFICDNAGTCQACRCQVLAGVEHLSPPSEAEQSWIPAEKLANGQRLACQVIIREQGEVRIESYAEYVRKLVLATLNPQPGTTMLDSLQPLVRNMLTDFADQLAFFPRNVFESLARIGPVRFAFPIQDGQRFLDDTARVIERIRTGAERIERAPRTPAGDIAPATPPSDRA